jgi:predicted glycoside hydrolase/deacetylase ChbG (UPF0249 family)
MYPSLNRTVLQSIENGIASSCSLMPPCPGARQALELLQQRPDIPFGVHLTLVCDFPSSRWQPSAAAEKVPSLLDGDGRLFSTDAKGQLLAQAQLFEVELELRSQIEAVLATGLIPTHLDWHSLADGDARISSILVWLWLRSTGWQLESGWNRAGVRRGNSGCRSLITTSSTASHSILRRRRAATCSYSTTCRQG